MRTENSLEANVYEVAILAVGVAWHAQFEWYAHERLARKAGVSDEALPLIKANAHPRHLEGILTEEELAAYTFSRELALTTRVSDETYQSTKTALGGDRAMADLSLTIACYHGVSVLLNSFEVALPAGVEKPFPEE